MEEKGKQIAAHDGIEIYHAGLILVFSDRWKWVHRLAGATLET